jgi:iron(III) transport system permease protein
VLALLEALADFGTVQYYGVQTFTTAIYRTWFGMGDRDGRRPDRDGPARDRRAARRCSSAIRAAAPAIMSPRTCARTPAERPHRLARRASRRAVPAAGAAGLRVPTASSAAARRLLGMPIAAPAFLREALHSLMLAAIAAVRHREARPVPRLCRPADPAARASTA